MDTDKPARIPPKSAANPPSFPLSSHCNLNLSLIICRTRLNGSIKANAAIIVRIRLYVISTLVPVSFVRNTAKYCPP